MILQFLRDLVNPVARYRQRSASETVPVGYDTMRRTEQRTQWNQDVTWLSVSLSLSLSLNFRTTDGGVDPAPELGHSSLKTA